MRKCIALLIPVLAAGAIVAGCGGGSSKTVNIPGGGQVSVSDKIPDSFPKDFPVYKGASVKGSYTGNSNGISGTVVTWETGDSVQKVKDFYDSALKDSSYSSTSSGDTGGSSFWAGESKDGKKAVYVMVTTENNKTSIIATVGDKPTDSSSSSSGSGSTSISDDDKTATAEAKSSSSSSSSGAEKSPTASPLPPQVTLAKDFPTDRVPLPSGARVTSSSSFSGGGSKTYSIEYYTKDAPDKAAEYFSTELPKHGWADSFSSNQNDEYFVTFSATASDGSTGESVIINASASDTAGYAKVSVTVSVKGA
jgi:hypothetical protein